MDTILLVKKPTTLQRQLQQKCNKHIIQDEKSFCGLVSNHETFPVKHFHCDNNF